MQRYKNFLILQNNHLNLLIFFIKSSKLFVPFGFKFQVCPPDGIFLHPSSLFPLFLLPLRVAIFSLRDCKFSLLFYRYKITQIITPMRIIFSKKHAKKHGVFVLLHCYSATVQKHLPSRGKRNFYINIYINIYNIGLFLGYEVIQFLTVAL